MVRESGLSAVHACFAVPSRPGEIPVAVKDVDASIEALDQAVRELGARLGPALADVCEEGVPVNGSMPKDNTCELGGSIKRHANVIRRITDDIDALRRRLEL